MESTNSQGRQASNNGLEAIIDVSPKSNITPTTAKTQVCQVPLLLKHYIYHIVEGHYSRRKNMRLSCPYSLDMLVFTSGLNCSPNMKTPIDTVIDHLQYIA